MEYNAQLLKSTVDAGVRVRTGDCSLVRDGSRYKMYRVYAPETLANVHTLACDSTDSDRLAAHWEGFCHHHNQAAR